MHLGMDGGIFYQALRLQNKTGDEFCKSRNIKNVSISKCILYFLQHMHKNSCFQAPKAIFAIFAIAIFWPERQTGEKNHNIHS